MSCHHPCYTIMVLQPPKDATSINFLVAERNEPHKNFPKMAQCWQTVTWQNSSTSHLFHELKNTTIFRGTLWHHFDTTNSNFPQIEQRWASIFRLKVNFYRNFIPFPDSMTEFKKFTCSYRAGKQTCGYCLQGLSEIGSASLDRQPRRRDAMLPGGKYL